MKKTDTFWEQYLDFFDRRIKAGTSTEKSARRAVACTLGEKTKHVQFLRNREGKIKGVAILNGRQQHEEAP